MAVDKMIWKIVLDFLVLVCGKSTNNIMKFYEFILCGITAVWRCPARSVVCVLSFSVI